MTAAIFHMTNLTISSSAREKEGEIGNKTQDGLSPVSDYLSPEVCRKINVQQTAPGSNHSR